MHQICIKMAAEFDPFGVDERIINWFDSKKHLQNFEASVLPNTEFLASLDEHAQQLFLHQLKLQLLEYYYELSEPTDVDTKDYIDNLIKNIFQN